MQEIFSQYHINEHTTAILPAKHKEYQSIVLEYDKELFIHKTPFELIKIACLDNYCTYEGRREAVTYHTGFKRKVPIPINPGKNIYSFPTHSIRDLDCNWIFYNHIKAIKKENRTKSVIIFKNGKYLQMGVSQYILEQQMQRTAEIVLNTPFLNNK